jgi:hypothetical protein
VWARRLTILQPRDSLIARTYARAAFSDATWGLPLLCYGSKVFHRWAATRVVPTWRRGNTQPPPTPRTCVGGGGETVAMVSWPFSYKETTQTLFSCDRSACVLRTRLIREKLDVVWRLVTHSTRQGWQERKVCRDVLLVDAGPRSHSHCYRGWQFAGRNPPPDRRPRTSSSSTRQPISIHA